MTFAAPVLSSVNADTCMIHTLECMLGHVLSDVVSRVLFLRQLHGRSLEIILCGVDVQEAFRQVPVDPSGAAVFACAVDGRCS